MLKVELFVISFWIFQEISPFWSWRGISSMSWAHKTRSLRGIYTQPSCSAQAAEKKIGLVLLHSFKIVFISLVLSIWCRFSWPAHNGSSRVMLVWVWKKSFCPDPLPSLLLWMPTDNGVNFSYLLSLTSALWSSNVPMFQSRAKKESAEMMELVKITLMILHSLVVFSMECSFSSLLIELVVS